MKKVLLRTNAPPVVMLVGEQGLVREIIRTDANWAGGAGTGSFSVNDAEWEINHSILQLDTNGNQTDDRFDAYRGTITLVADATAVDGYKWYAAVFTKPRRHYSFNSLAGAFWFTFENPYHTADRTPATLGALDTSPYLPGTDPALIDQPVDAGALEYSFPKASLVDGGASKFLDLPLYGIWANRCWIRPQGANAQVVIDVF